MARITRYTSYDDRSVHDEQIAGADDSMPLFLSGYSEPPGQRGFGKGREKPAISSLILKASIAGTVAATIAFAVVSVQNPLALFANAKASLIGLSANLSSPAASGAAQARPGQPTSAQTNPVRSVAVQPVPASQSAAGTAPAAASALSREEIVAAFKSAQQGQPEIPPPAAATPPVRRLDPEQLANLMKRAKGLIETGDIPPARLLLERAADAQAPGAALLLAQTYDPAVLGRLDTRSITPDPATARLWYQKAARLGSLDAQTRLAQMQN
jgi:TPR repeat protein